MIREGNEVHITRQGFLIMSHPLTYFEIQSYYQNEPKFKVIYSPNGLPNTFKNGAYVVNLDEYKSIQTYWIVFYVNSNNMTFFDSLVVEYTHSTKNFLPTNVTWQISSV